jgi:hypothetical protein
MLILIILALMAMMVMTKSGAPSPVPPPVLARCAELDRSPGKSVSSRAAKAFARFRDTPSPGNRADVLRWLNLVAMDAPNDLGVYTEYRRDIQAADFWMTQKAGIKSPENLLAPDEWL